MGNARPRPILPTRAGPGGGGAAPAPRPHQRPQQGLKPEQGKVLCGKCAVVEGLELEGDGGGVGDGRRGVTGGQAHPARGRDSERGLAPGRAPSAALPHCKGGVQVTSMVQRLLLLVLVKQRLAHRWEAAQRAVRRAGCAGVGPAEHAPQLGAEARLTAQRRAACGRRGGGMLETGNRSTAGQVQGAAQGSSPSRLPALHATGIRKLSAETNVPSSRR